MIEKDIFLWILTQGYPVNLTDKARVEAEEKLKEGLTNAGFFVYNKEGKLYVESGDASPLFGIHVKNNIITFHNPDQEDSLVDFPQCGLAFMKAIEIILSYPPVLNPIQDTVGKPLLKDTGKKNYWAI